MSKSGERTFPSITRRGLVLIGLQLGVTGALAWRGYDLNFEHGKFRLVPIAG